MMKITPITNKSVSIDKAWRVALITSLTLVSFISEVGAVALAGRTESRAEVLIKHEVDEIKEALQKVTATPESTKKEISDLTQKLGSLQLLSGTTEQESTKPPQGETVSGIESDFEQFKAKLRSVTFYEADDGTPSLEGKSDAHSSIQAVKYYAVEEDLLLDELELLLYHQQAKALASGKSDMRNDPAAFATTFTSADSSTSRLNQTPLRAATEQGNIVRWIPGSTLKYCVLGWTFGGDRAKYDLVVNNMHAACQNWSETCKIKFEHVQRLDNVARGTVFPTASDGKREVLFVVVDKEMGDIIAKAFFPNDSIYSRILFVNPSKYFSTTIDKVGILRHELGHVLGFRHEHISPKAPVWTSKFCSEESAQGSKEITSYDRASVMHYPCASSLGGGSLPENLKLEITQLDRQGAQAVYGAPTGSPPSPSSDRFRDFDPAP